MLHFEAREASARTVAKMNDFFAQMSRTSARALLLDYDGTLAPFCVDPECAAPYPGVPALLERIRDRGRTRLVVISGRRASDALRLLGLKRIEVWGSHGLERLRADGTYEMPALDDRVLQSISEAYEQLSDAGLSARAECKPGGVAVHWRGLGPLSTGVRQKVLNVWSGLRHRKGICLMRFDGGMEIRVDCRNKGDAVRAVLSEMDKNASVAYLGDDETDEDGFAALHGYGLSVLVQRTRRPTVADVTIRPPDGLIAFLEDWVSASGGVL